MLGYSSGKQPVVRVGVLLMLLAAGAGCAPPAPDGYSTATAGPANAPPPLPGVAPGEDPGGPGTPAGGGTPTMMVAGAGEVPGAGMGAPAPGTPSTGTPGTPTSPDPAPGTTPTPGTSGEAPTEGPPGVFDAGSDPNRNNVQAGQLCARLTAIQCAGEAFCCQTPGRDRASCEAALLDACQNEAYFDSLSTNAMTGFDAAAASAALTQAEALASTCDPAIVAFLVSADGLAGVFKGTKALGADCSPGFSLDLEVAAAQLASCASPGTNACLPESAFSWACKAPSGAGAGCFTDINCQEGHYCPNPDLEIAMASCAPRKAMGAPCSAANECQSLFCGAGACTGPDAQLAYCPAP